MLSILTSIFRWTWVSGYRNISIWILLELGAKDDGGGGDN